MFPMRWLLLFILLMSCGFNPAASKSIQPSNESEQLKLSKICLTETCNNTASEISNIIDPTADPCDDFYQFACGGYVKTANITMVTRKNQIFIDQLIKDLKGTIKKDEPRPLKMVKYYFQSCMNESAIEENSVDSLLQIIKSVGGWPIIEGEKWNESNFDWIKSITELLKMGYIIENMPELRVIENENFKTKIIFFGSDPRNFIFRSEVDNKTKDILREDFVNITVAFGANRTFADKETRDLFSFVSTLYAFRDNPKENVVSEKFGELSNSPGGFPIKEIIEKLILPFSNIDNDTDVFSENLIGILMNNTSKRVQANYIIWSFISQSVKSLKKDIREKYKKLLEDGGFFPISENSSRTDECFETTKKSMPFSLMTLYVRNNFDRNTKNEAIKILENIRKQILKNIDEMTNTQIKDIFHNKIEKMKFFVAYDGDYFNDTELEELDKDLNISSSNDYLRNNINLMGSIRRKKSFNLLKPVEKILEDHIPGFFQYNPRYDPDINTIVIPAPLFQGFTNEIDYPEYIKYGATGFIFGHELYHGIDNINRDSDGNFQRIFWDNTSKEIFSRQEECLIDQYGNYSLGGEKLNGKELLTENIADNGGMKAAYLAFSNFASKRDEPELLLPNLRYTPKQLFWIIGANDFCGQQKPPISYDKVHTPLHLRLLGAFSNMPEFARDFNCPVGSKMNPSKKCSVI